MADIPALGDEHISALQSQMHTEQRDARETTTYSQDI